MGVACFRGVGLTARISNDGISPTLPHTTQTLLLTLPHSLILSPHSDCLSGSPSVTSRSARLHADNSSVDLGAGVAGSDSVVFDSEKEKGK